jgi:hypothetical protein
MDEYAKDAYGLTEQHLICMVYSPFAGEGAGRETYLAREQAALADQIEGIRTLLGSEDRPEALAEVVSALGRISGLDLRQLRVLYRSPLRASSAAADGNDLLGAILDGDPHKDAIRTQNAPNGPVMLEIVVGTVVMSSSGAERPIFVQVGAIRDGLDPYLHCARRRGMRTVLVETPAYLRRRTALGRRRFDVNLAAARPHDPSEVTAALDEAGLAPTLLLTEFERYAVGAFAACEMLRVAPWPGVGRSFVPVDKWGQRNALAVSPLKCGSLVSQAFRRPRRSARTLPSRWDSR